MKKYFSRFLKLIAQMVVGDKANNEGVNYQVNKLTTSMMISIFITELYIYIIGENKTKMGVYIGADPIIRLLKDVDSRILFNSVNDALLMYKENVPHPTDWKKFAEDFKNKVNEMGIGSLSRLYTNKTKSYTIIKEGNLVTIIPCFFDKLSKSFVHMPEKEIVIDFSNENAPQKFHLVVDKTPLGTQSDASLP